MGAFLLGAGTKGKRYSMPNARIMIHQPLGGASGQAVDIEIQVHLQSFIEWTIPLLDVIHLSAHLRLGPPYPLRLARCQKCNVHCRLRRSCTTRQT